MPKKRRIFETSGPTLQTDPTLLEHLHSLYPTLNTSAGAANIVEGMRTLHHGLTKGRTGFVGRTYLDDPEIRLAYDTYMLSVQSPKLSPILALLEPLFSPKGRPLRVLDIGCGTGTASIATSLWFQDRGLSAELTYIDHSKAALQQTQRHLDVLHSGKHTMRYTQGKQLHETIGADGPYDLIVMMNIVNELPSTLNLELEKSLQQALDKDGFLIVVEPSTKASSRRTIDFRNHLTSQRWSVLYPCPRSLVCPMSANESDWCHDTWRYSRPDFVQRVDHTLGLRREVLKATWFVLTSPQASPNSPQAPLVIGERIEEKGRSVLHICTGDELMELELQKKDCTDTNKAFRQAARYHRVRYSDTVQKGPRQRLTTTSEVYISSLDDG